MRLRHAMLSACATVLLPAHAQPVPGHDYQSLQIASSQDLPALQKLYARYSQLPYLRLEKRNAIYVLRAGFWDSARAGRAALAQTPVPGGQMRTATLRPEALVQHNWTDPLPPGPTAAPATPLPPPAPPAVATTPTAPLPAADRLKVGDDLRSFHAEDFALAYDVLLSTGDLRRAFQVAQQAVNAVPTDHLWRRKLARVAEWTQRPEVAAEQWRALFQLGDHSEEVLTNVLRLSAQMEDPSVALQVWKIRAQTSQLNPAQWEEVLQLFEEMAQPGEGSRFFEAQYLRTQDTTLLDHAARLAEHAGEDERALALHLQRASLLPFSMDSVLQAVVQLVRTDRMAQALALLQTHSSQVPPEAAEYWRMLGQIAWELGHLDAAQSAYQRYVQTPQAGVADWSRLVFLVRQEHPAQAAALALDAYRRFDALEQLVLALEIYAGLGDLQAQGRIYASLQGTALQRAQTQQRFLLLRAQYHQRSRQPELAWSDLQLALHNSPHDKDTVLTALWFLIDEGRNQPLAILLQQNTAAAADPAYWLAYAAGNQALGRHREALRWYAREVRRNPQDPLLLLNYADALEQVQQAGMAARIRRHAWLQLKQKYPSPSSVPATAFTPELLAVARLALLNQPGDPALQQVRRMTEKMRGLPSPQTDTETRALVLGWALSQSQFANARSWIWLRYTRQLQQAAALWGEAQVALNASDTQTMERLLASTDRSLPVPTRYDLAYASGHTAQALDMAFQGMQHQDPDDALHDRFRQHALDSAPYAQLLLSQESLGALERQGVHAEARWPLSPAVNLLLGWARAQQSSDDPLLQPLTPGTDRLEHLEAQWRSSRGTGSLALFHRAELQNYTGLQWKQTYRWDQRLGLEAGLDYRADSTLSLPLRVAGYEHGLYGTLNYALSKRHYLRATPRLSQYYTQYDDYLGSGRLLDLEAGYRLRTEYPDWRLRALLSQQDFSRDGGIAPASLAQLPAVLQTSIASGAVDPRSYFIPDSNTSWGLCLGMGENVGGQSLQTVYSRAWRPYIDLCLRDNSRTGNGYTAVAGMAGSWAGEDHVAVELQNSDGLSTVEGPTRMLTVRYRHYF